MCFGIQTFLHSQSGDGLETQGGLEFTFGFLLGLWGVSWLKSTKTCTGEWHLLSVFSKQKKKRKKRLSKTVKGYVFLKKSFRTCLFLWDFWILFYSRRMHIEWGLFFSLQINIFEDAEQTTASSNNRFILSLGDIQKYMNALYTSFVGVDNRVVTEPHPCLHGTHS